MGRSEHRSSTLLSAEEKASRREELLQLKLVEEKRCTEEAASMRELHGKITALTIERLRGLVQQAEEFSQSNGRLFSSRTKYKMDVDAKNASLQYLLSRAASAIEICSNGAEAGDANKKKGGLKKVGSISEKTKKK